MEIKWYIFLSLVLFCIGIIGALTRRNSIIVFMCIELMLNSVNLLLIAFSKMHLATPNAFAGTMATSAQIFVFFIMIVAAAEESGKTVTLTAWKNAWLAKDDEGRFIADGIKTNQRIMAAAEVYEQYLLELKARKLFDYDDMILRAVHALETNNDLKFTLQEKYQYILLDEFQDTNEAQLRIVQLLTDNPVNEGRPNVMADQRVNLFYKIQVFAGNLF